MRRTLIVVGAGWALLAAAPDAGARPPGPQVFCDTYPDAPVCASGLPDCATCHMGPPVRNQFGASIEAVLLPGEPRPLSDADFAAALPGALAAVEGDDSDGDGFSNIDEINGGTGPGDAGSKPGEIACAENDFFNLCDYDHAFAYKRVALDFCGRSPTFEDMEAFRSMSIAEKEAEIDRKLGACLDSDFWQGTDGVLWNLANRKIRPVGSLKAGPEPGSVPLADYDHDYNLFVWSQIDDHDAREAMTADFFVVRDQGQLRPITPAEEQAFFVNGDRELVPVARRAGLLTTRWNLAYFEMFAVLPRAAAAQARRAWLRQDWAKMEGLNPVAGQPIDYDNAGVDEPLCAMCHSTIDAEAQAWRNYAGLIGGGVVTYVNDRMSVFEPIFPGISAMGDGFFNGRLVGEVIDWARAAADSDQFARATVMDYFELLVDDEVEGELETIDYQTLWEGFRSEDSYSVEKMLRRLVRTRSYGEP